MKHQRNWQQVIAVTISLGLPVSLTSTAIANTINSNNSQLLRANVTELNSEMRIAQNLGTCYQVTAESGLYVRNKPTVYSEALSILNFGQNVTIALSGTEGNWMPILAPTRGYVWADWLAPC